MSPLFKFGMMVLVPIYTQADPTYVFYNCAQPGEVRDFVVEKDGDHVVAFSYEIGFECKAGNATHYKNFIVREEDLSNYNPPKQIKKKSK